jgi:hypothetical protein
MSVLFLIKDNNSDPRGWVCPPAHQFTFHRVQKDDQRIAALPRDSWNLVETDIEDAHSDAESEFDEELLVLDPYAALKASTLDDSELVDHYVLRILKERYECAAGAPFDAEQCVREYVEPLSDTEFDSSSVDNLKSLIVAFSENKTFRTIEPVRQVHSKYSTTNFIRNHWIICKSQRFADLSRLYAVFTLCRGCCNSSYRLQRIYSSLDHAKNACKKAHNAFAIAHYNGVVSKNHFEQNLSSAELYQFEYDAERGCFATLPSKKINYE